MVKRKLIQLHSIINTLHSVVPAPFTIIDNIQKLEPGYSITVHKSGNDKINILILMKFSFKI